ncbi:YicC/YloC family endoribonuclease, partial [Desulfothermus sp.]
MIKSMTGYGSYELNDEICMQHWEIKSVNSKNLNVRFKIPSFLRSVEYIFLREVKKFVSRGYIDIYLGLKIFKHDQVPFQINETLLDVLFGFLKRYAKENGEVFVPDYNRVVSIPGLWTESAIDAESELVDRLKNGLENALLSWNQFREREGQDLVLDLKSRLTRLVDIRDKIEQITNGLVSDKFELLRQRVREILKRIDIEVEQDRLMQELAIMADRLDVSEELVRLTSHLNAILDLLNSEGYVGRQLDFLCQECFREINTLGNKAQ